jgi:hypothetical protein
MGTALFEITPLLALLALQERVRSALAPVLAPLAQESARSAPVLARTYSPPLKLCGSY